MDRKRTGEESGSSRSDDANGFVSGAYEEDGQLQHTIVPWRYSVYSMHPGSPLPSTLRSVQYSVYNSLWLYKLDNQRSGFVFLYLILMRKPYVTAVHLGHHSSMTSPNFSTPNLDSHLPIPYMHAYGELRDIYAVRRSRLFNYLLQSIYSVSIARPLLKQIVERLSLD